LSKESPKVKRSKTNQSVGSDTDSFSEKFFALPAGDFQPLSLSDGDFDVMTVNYSSQTPKSMKDTRCCQTSEIAKQTTSTQTQQTVSLAKQTANASTQHPTVGEGYSLGSTNQYIFDRKIMYSNPRLPKTPPGYKVSPEDRETNRNRALRLHELLKLKRKEDPGGRYFISGPDVVQVTTVEHAPVLTDDLAAPEPDFWYGHIDTEWFDEELTEAEVSCFTN
jgi:hypothetical protein